MGKWDCGYGTCGGASDRLHFPGRPLSSPAASGRRRAAAALGRGGGAGRGGGGGREVGRGFGGAGGRARVRHAFLTTRERAEWGQRISLRSSPKAHFRRFSPPSGRRLHAARRVGPTPTPRGPPPAG